MGRLENKVAVITGASSGIGLATAKRYVEEGAFVYITGRRQEQLDRAVEAIGRNVASVSGDAASLKDLDRLFAQVERDGRRIDVLFASAGRATAATIGTVTEEQFDDTFNLNTRGTLFTVQKALPLFNNSGSIIINGSIASTKGWPGAGVYAASKAALRSFARTWLVELIDRRIRVNVLSPGPTDTAAMENAPQAMKDQFRMLVPRKALGTPEELASVALFLASDESSFVNGVELSVDGGTAQI